MPPGINIGFIFSMSPEFSTGMLGLFSGIVITLTVQGISRFIRFLFERRRHDPHEEPHGDVPRRAE